jgi:hypothetical protein
VTSLASSLLVKFFLKDIGYTAFYTLGGVLTLISLVLLFFLKEEKVFK